MKEDVCKICSGNHYYIVDENVIQCSECVIQGYEDEQEDIPNETRTKTLYPINS
jgi:Zn ribbon nucleic-acid-binding protein